MEYVGRARAWIGYSLVSFLAFVVVLASGGAAFEAIASSGDGARLPPPGRLVDVGGYRLHLNCMGEGTPAAIFDAGLGQSSLDWTLVQPEVARTTRTCVYDRAGMGWSDPSPRPRTPAIIAEELHTLLTNAGIRGPYVLVGHSLAGKNARMFAIQHPSEVAGLVLVDARHEYLDEIATSAENQAFYDAVDAQGTTYAWARRLGVVRTFGSSLAGEPTFSDETRSALALLATRANAIAATSAEARARAANDADLHASTLGDRPLMVLVSGQSLSNVPHWAEGQRRQAMLSFHSEMRVAQGSGHCIQCDDARLVTSSVREIVIAARANDGSQERVVLAQR